MSVWKANRLRVLRAERRVSQREIAQRAGMSQATYWKYENAYAEPSRKEKARIAKALRVTIDALNPQPESAVA